MSAARRLGVFGGAFDPPHIAHVALALGHAEHLARGVEFGDEGIGRQVLEDALHAHAEGGDVHGGAFGDVLGDGAAAADDQSPPRHRAPLLPGSGLLDDLVQACQPRRMTVVGDFSVRGGIKTVVTATYAAPDSGTPSSPVTATPFGSSVVTGNVSGSSRMPGRR